jgi:hypothetical protein
MGGFSRLPADIGPVAYRKLGAYALLPIIAITSLVLPGPSSAQDGGYPKQHLEWQRECVRKNLYTRAARRESLGRFNISIEIPANMDFLIDDNEAHENKDANNIIIAEIADIALRKCNKLAQRLHGMALPGAGMASFSITGESSSGTPSITGADFVDAAMLMGQKRPIYRYRSLLWASFAQPKSGKDITVWSYDIEDTYFIQFIRSIRGE